MTVTRIFATTKQNTAIAIFAGMVLTVPSCTIAADEVDFAKDVFPILEEQCLGCHGPDESESGLRLDSMVEILRGGDSGEKAVVPGHDSKSYLIELLTTSDPGRQMPPDSDPLPEEQIETLRAWINNAAAWKDAQQAVAEKEIDHWSFQPLIRPDVPAPHASSSDSNAIDAFVNSKLADAGLKMSPAAERRRRIRRLYLVMHGLIPSPEQVEAFVNDPRSDKHVWQELVTNVLASPRYGERWAQHWLDLVRFGETNGFETNRERPYAWPYRDWVISAFNDDKPYDQFIVQQLAGDAVGADVGTAFLVAGPMDLVKGKNPELQLTQRQDELADMINTTSTAFLGLTVGCARCHNHKFDPISQTDYYAMQAVFAGVHHGDRNLPLSDETKQQIADLNRNIKQLDQHLATFLPKKQPGIREPVKAKQNVEDVGAVRAKFVRFTINATNGGQPCIDELEIFSGDKNVGLASAGAKASSSGDFKHPLHKLEHINDGVAGNARSWISAQKSGGWVQVEFPSEHQINRVVWARDRQGKYRDRLATDYQIDVSVDGEKWVLVSSSKDRSTPRPGNTDEQKYDFAAFSQAEADAGRRSLAQRTKFTKSRDTLADSQKVYAGTFRQPKATHRLYRGEPLSPKEQVSPAGIASLNGVQLAADSAEQLRRVELAKWMVDKQNPLTARVMVNRLWQFHFGTGIVDTPSDFGGNGTLPSHPELLDWLAVEFVDSGWSVKHIHRLLLLSSTWQQDSQPKANAMAVDAASRMLWRFPPRRMEAEGIRDCMLVATGKLDLEMGGPGFSAFEVDLENVRHYFPKKTFGPEDWRRMVYQTKVRQEKDAVFGVFDCPDGSQVTPKRSRSTTPLQALNLLNSNFVMQQAELFVNRLDAERQSPEDKIERAYDLCFGRSPDNEELNAAIGFVSAQGWTQLARAMLNANEFVFIP